MKKSKTWFLFISLILLVFVRYVLTRPVYKDGDKVVVSGTVISDPIKYSTSQYIKLAGLNFYLPVNPEIYYGDKIVVSGTAKSGKIETPKLEEIKKEKGFASSLRNSLVSFYDKVLPQPMSGLIAGITLGSKGALTRDFYDMTKVTGVAHVVVASGTNVTFVVSFLVAVFSAFLPRRKSIPFVILGIVLYLFLSGFDAPLIRAAIMATFAFVAQETGRLISSFRILVLTAGVMLIYDPDWVTDIGFILSFASTISIMTFQAKLNKVFRFLPNILKEDVVTTFSAQIGVTPILFVTFGRFSIWSPLVNALVLWIVPILMI